MSVGDGVWSGGLGGRSHILRHILGFISAQGFASLPFLYKNIIYVGV